MPVESVKRKGWLVVDPRWLASLFHLETAPDGSVPWVDADGKLRIPVRHAALTREGQIVVGLASAVPAIVPHGFAEMTEGGGTGAMIHFTVPRR